MQHPSTLRLRRQSQVIHPSQPQAAIKNRSSKDSSIFLGSQHPLSTPPGLRVMGEDYNDDILSTAPIPNGLLAIKVAQPFN